MRTIIGAYRDREAIGMRNPANEPDLFAHPGSAAGGRRWVLHELFADAYRTFLAGNGISPE